ncbi:PREDICTED: putative fatty acyl-CoA reductase CG5065 [Ceratosolen solmsi marchali]|uniref:Fatty acyl-CoA reductase n=1 Tax=Ceratosolen solmsi marchali TaxID=326594 RepID=A0AAJ7E0Z1_9HYME|nr:PREDICTED: putative fatty acyl-CoA reductase CG5065 [Ceratosolen solmsi marchali]
MEQLSPIQLFYKEKTILITGGSGFMGKVLIEKLLYSCSNLKRIYILMRSKHNKSAEIRINDMLKLPIFNRIKQVKPETLKKLVPLFGDLSLHNLGLSKEHEMILKTEVNILFHCAATLRLEASLRDAILINTVGTKNILTLAKEIVNLKAFIHLSTAFCHVDQQELSERIYDTSDNPNDIIKFVDWLKDNALSSITSKMIEPHPNTYTYSKRLAEELVAQEFPNLRCAIARPSIVTPAWSEPLPGWVDNLNGPVGLIVGAGKGIIRSMHCNGNYHAEINKYTCIQYYTKWSYAYYME